MQSSARGAANVVTRLLSWIDRSLDV